MKRTLLAFTLIVLCLGLFAQWSTNAAAPNQICNLTAAQVLPKTAITQSGITWLAWMDNTTGNYNTYLQKLDINGVPMWTNPLLVSNHTTMTWITEWDIDAHPDGSAILVFQDIRNVTNNVVAYKIWGDGAFAWGSNGIALSADNSTDIVNMSPTVICVNDGRTYVAWQRMGTVTEIKLQCISGDGTLTYGPGGITLAPVSGSYTWPQFVESANSDILLKFYEDTGPFWAPNRKILVNKFGLSGIPLWTAPTYIQNLGGLAAWNQWLSLASDGLGGMILGWHEDRNAENISYTYIQHVLTDGTVTMPANGVRVSLEQGFHQFYPKLAYDPDLQEAYVFWNRVNGGQSMWGLHMQKLTLDGVRQWGDNGMDLIALGNFSTYPIRAFKLDSGAALVYSIATLESSDQPTNLAAFCVNPSGQSMWTGGLGSIATTNTNKLHYDSALHHDLWGVVTWEDGIDPSHVYAMRLNYNGTLGTIIPSPYNLTAEVNNQNEVLLQWNFPDLEVGPIGYRVYRNSVFYHLVTGGTTFQDLITNLGPGEWTFYVTALYESTLESPPSNSVIINITGNQDEQTPVLPLTLSVYPNPCQNSANLQLKGMNPAIPTSCSIYNLKGQLVRQFSFFGKRELNWLWDGNDTSQTEVSPGLYIIKLDSGPQRITAKLLKF